MCKNKLIVLFSQFCDKKTNALETVIPQNFDSRADWYMNYQKGQCCHYHVVIFMAV